LARLRPRGGARSGVRAFRRKRNLQDGVPDSFFFFFGCNRLSKARVDIRLSAGRSRRMTAKQREQIEQKGRKIYATKTLNKLCGNKLGGRDGWRNRPY